MSINPIVKKLIDNNCDYEYYPTTQKIVDVIVDKIIGSYSGRRDECNRILDIGCGKGDFFQKLEISIKRYNRGEYMIPAHNKFGIEKSPVLIENMPDNIVLLGTDFHEQSLIDKKMDLIFCNPPYSEYKDWMERIIREGNSTIMVFVVPERWNDSEKIKESLKKRNYKTQSLGNFDFLDAERKARAKVDIVYLCEYPVEDENGRYGIKDAFDTWFDDTFKISAAKEKESDYEFEKSKSELIENELIRSGNVAEQLIMFYQRDMEHLFNNYKLLESLDSDLLKVLNVDIKNLKESLKEKIKGLKHIYWDKLFNRYNEITKRLTSYSRERFLNKLHENADIDFTLNNIFAVTLWIIKNSNTMYDEQLKDFYMKLADKDSIQMYKSDKRFTDDEWRYIKLKVHEYSYKWKEVHFLKNFMYDYRIVYKKCCNNFDGYKQERFSNNTFDFIWDTIHIAENLGFCFADNVFYTNQWQSVSWTEGDIFYKDGKPFVNIKLYQNGNIHLKFDMEFMQRMNIEAARLFGWITDRKEASEEMGMSEADAARAWNCNAKILPTSSVNMIEWKK